VRTRVAIIGSRTYTRLLDVRDFVAELPRDVLIVSGGAVGVDRVAEEEAQRLRLSRLICEPESDLFAPRAVMTAALHARNDEILRYAHRVVAFWDGESRGTASVIEKAHAMGKVVEVRRP
jgi:hypothetical protein